MVTSAAIPEEAEQPGDAEHADPDTGPLALLGDLGLRQADLGPDEVGNLVGELMDEGTEGLTLRRTVLLSHAPTLPNLLPDHQRRFARRGGRPCWAGLGRLGTGRGRAP